MPFSPYQGARALVTGGLGFIGSHLSEKLVELGADVTIVDSLIPEYGGNPFNVREFALASRDRYFLCIEAADPRFHAEGTRQFLEALGPSEVSEVDY